MRWNNNSSTGFIAQEVSDVLRSWVEQSQLDSNNLTVKDTYSKDSGNIVFNTGSSEMMRITEDGFWVRGVKVEQGAKEASTVYNVFRQWLTWAQLNKE